MPRRFLKKYLPSPDRIKHHDTLRRVLGELVHDPNLWHINRRSMSLGIGIGLFCAFLPIPMQMAIAALLALWWRGNLPIAVCMVWITNPLTMGPIFFFCYRLGAWLLDRPTGGHHIEWSLVSLGEQLARVWEPLLLGSLVVGTLAAVAGYGLTLLGWRLSINWKMRRRQLLRRRPRQS